VENFDVVIIGAGSAGCVLAGRLSEDRTRKVLLLEAGGVGRHPAIRVPAAFPTLFDSSIDWGYRSVPQPGLADRPIFWPRGKVLGGSSALNAMMWVRGFPSDYDGWARLAGSHWSYEQLLPYFQRAEAAATGVEGPYGRDGPLPVSNQGDPNPLTFAFLAAAAECGIGPNTARNDGPEEGVCLTLVNQLRGARVSAAAAYLAPASARQNLVVRTRALVERLVIRNGRCTGVSYLRRGRPETVGAGTVLCCSGAIDSPKLLLASGIGPAEELAGLGVQSVVDSPEVGKNLADHLTAGIALAAQRAVSLAGARRPASLVRYLVSRRGLLSSNICEAYGFIRSDAALPECDLELLFVPAAFVNEGLSLPSEHGLTIAAVLLQPKSRGEVRLASLDPTAAPVIDPAYLSDPGGEDAHRLEEGIRRCIEIARAPSLAEEAGRLIAPEGELDEGLVEPALRHYAQTLYHPVGTCRMGLDDASVVDPFLAVRGVENLRVVDASVIPAIPHGHTHAPVVAIAERAAEFLAAG
jgi:choline dehydrogenase-like flavoprotein